MNPIRKYYEAEKEQGLTDIQKQLAVNQSGVSQLVYSCQTIHPR